MRYIFEIEDEKTITNTTVKVFVQVSGPDNASREQLETRVKKALHEFIPSATWAFAGFSQTRIQGYPMFSVQASARINAEQNDNLAERARDLELDGVSINVISIDLKVPTHLLREGYAVIRSNLLDLALEEVDNLRRRNGDFKHLRIKTISYKDSSPSVSGKFSTANAYSNAAGSGDEAIGYSEKISVTATVTLTDGEDEAESEVTINNI